MSVRLTTWMREDIVRSILKHKFKGSYEMFLEGYAKLAKDVYDDVFPAAVRRRMGRLPEGWLPKKERIDIQFGEDGQPQYISLNFNGCIRKGKEGAGVLTTRETKHPKEVWKLMPYAKFHGCAKVYAPTHPLAERYFVLANLLMTQVIEYREVQKLAEQGVAQATTVSKLIEVWPEVEPFAKQYLKHEPADRSLPVPRLVELNRALGLPVGSTP